LHLGEDNKDILRCPKFFDTLSMAGKQGKQKERVTWKMTAHAPRLSVFQRHLDNALKNML